MWTLDKKTAALSDIIEGVPWMAILINLVSLAQYG